MKGRTFIFGVWVQTDCRKGIQTVPMNDCRQQWVVVDDQEDIYVMREDRLRALGYDMLKIENKIVDIVVLPVVTCGMVWDIKLR